MKNSLALTAKIGTHLKLSPAQIQVMRMLEIPACELQAHIDEELQKNPALEEGQETNQEVDFDSDQNEENYDDHDTTKDNYDYGSDDPLEDDNYAPTSTNGRGHEDIPFSMGTSFAEYLKSQIYLTKMDKPDRHIAKFVVGNIDEDGYLRRTVEELVDDLCFREGLQVTDKKMQEIVNQVKEFEPIGVGAYDIQECLLIQLKHKEQTPSVQLASTIILHHFETFSRKNFSKLQQRLSISEDLLKAATAEIMRLNPRPGSAWLGTVLERNQSIIIPDFIIEQVDDELVITLNHGNISPLHVSKEYQIMLEEYSHIESNNKASIRDAAKFVKTNIDNAKYFIDAIRQRNETLMRTMKVLVALQRDFFIHGDSTYLKPLTLKHVAERSGYDTSTVSRAFSKKYVQTEFGIFPVKFFLSDKIVNNEGDAVSTRGIKQKLQEVIENEDKTNPITDDQLVEIMHAAGYPIARRTVAKYRDQMSIPIARMRRQMSK